MWFVVFIASFITYCLENPFLWDLKFLFSLYNWTKCPCRGGQSFEKLDNDKQQLRWILFVLSGSEEMPRYTEISAISGLLCMHGQYSLFLGTQKKFNSRKMTRSKRKFLSRLGLLKASSFPLLQDVGM